MQVVIETETNITINDFLSQYQKDNHIVVAKNDKKFYLLSCKYAADYRILWYWFDGRNHPACTNESLVELVRIIILNGFKVYWFKSVDAFIAFLKKEF